MPFTLDQFLDLLGTYNTQLGPVIGAVWLVSVLAVAMYFRGDLTVAAAASLLAVHWAWSGVVFHAVYFTRVNPAAWLFAALFLAEAVALAWLARSSRRGTRLRRAGQTPRQVLADVFVIAAIVYPFLVLATGHALPRAPLFAVPCPTLLLTAGVLLTLGPRAPRWLAVIPVLWSAIGGSAAILLTVVPDYLLLAAGASLVAFVLLPRHKPPMVAHAGRSARARGPVRTPAAIRPEPPRSSPTG